MDTSTTVRPWPASPRSWVGFTLAIALVFAVFDGAARAFGSDRGQAGLQVALIVVAAICLVELLSLGGPPSSCLRRLGLGVPAGRGLLVGLVGALMVLVVPVYFGIARGTFGLQPGWWALLPGLFAQAGVAEETLFRGYLFRHLRNGRSFRRAALLSCGPFVLAHLPLFATLPWAIALASILLAALISFPFAWLFELSGKTIWAPALVHFVVQAVPKVLVLEPGDLRFASVWMVASAVVPLVAFAWRRDETQGAG